MPAIRRHQRIAYRPTLSDAPQRWTTHSQSPSTRAPTSMPSAVPLVVLVLAAAAALLVHAQAPITCYKCHSKSDPNCISRPRNVKRVECLFGYCSKYMMNGSYGRVVMRECGPIPQACQNYFGLKNMTAVFTYATCTKDKCNTATVPALASLNLISAFVLNVFFVR